MSVFVCVCVHVLASCLPLIPEKGTVGASGDLAPLSHLALGLMGEGHMWSPASGWSLAQDVLQANNINHLKLAPKEVIITIRTRCYIVTRCTNLVSVHYFLPLGI